MKYVSMTEENKWLFKKIKTQLRSCFCQSKMKIRRGINLCQSNRMKAKVITELNCEIENLLVEKLELFRRWQATQIQSKAKHTDRLPEDVDGA